MSDKMSEVDWDNDEAVVRAAVPSAWLRSTHLGFGVSAIDGDVHLDGSSWKRNSDEAWNAARHHSTVVAFERENRPVSEVEAAKKAVLDQYNAGNCGICNTPVFSMGGMIFHAHNIPPSAESHEATLLRPSKLTPAAVAGDAVQCSVCNHALHEGACNAAMDCLCVQYPPLRGVKVADPVGEREGEFEKIINTEKYSPTNNGWGARCNSCGGYTLNSYQVTHDSECPVGIEEKVIASASSKCPICGVDTPHHHLSEELSRATLASKPSAEGIPKERFYLGQQERDALEATISSKEEEVARLSELLEIEAKLSDKRAGKWLKEFDRAQAAEAELSALKLSSARIEEETLRKLINLYCSRCRSGVPLYEDSRGLLMHRYDANDSRDCGAGMIHRMLIPTSPESQAKGGE